MTVSHPLKKKKLLPSKSNCMHMHCLVLPLLPEPYSPVLFFIHKDFDFQYNLTCRLLQMRFQISQVWMAQAISHKPVGVGIKTPCSQEKYFFTLLINPLYPLIFLFFYLFLLFWILGFNVCF